MKRIKNTIDLLKNEDYYFSSDIEEYNSDRAGIIKLLTRRIRQCFRSPNEENILKLVNCLLLMRNIFEKGAILEYLLSYFKLEDSLAIVKVIYLTLILRDEGVILNQSRYLLYSEMIEKLYFDANIPLDTVINYNINTIMETVFRQ